MKPFYKKVTVFLFITILFCLYFSQVNIAGVSAATCDDNSVLEDDNSVLEDDNSEMADTTAAAEILGTPDVLCISSYSYDWESVPMHLEGINDTIGNYATINYVFMDTKRLEYDEVKQNVYDEIASREKSKKFDYIIAIDDDALRFVLEYRDKLFEGIPVVFEGINDVDYGKKIANDSHITGINETFPLGDTISLALKLNPDAERVVGISDDTVSGQGSTKQLMECQDMFPAIDFSTIDCSSLTLDEIGDKVAECGDDTILIYLMMTADIDGNTYTHNEAIKYITSKVKIPVYKADELGMGKGILGGVVVSYYDMAVDAGNIVLELINGADITQYKVRQADYYCEFDANVMKKFGIKKSNVLAAYDGGNIRFINEKTSIFQKHKSVLIPSGIIILLLITVSIMGMAELRNKKRLMKDITNKDLMLNSVLDNIPGGIAVYRVNGNAKWDNEIIYFSKGLEKLSGKKFNVGGKNIKGGLLYDSIVDEDKRNVIEIIDMHIPEKKSFYCNFHLKKVDGTYAYVTMNAIWGYDERNGSSIYYGVYLDMTQQEQAQTAEREAAKAKASNAAKSEFLSRMSHDMRTPLNAVLGFAALAADEPGNPEKTAEYLEKIHISGNYLLSLINDVLDMSRIENSRMEIHEKSVYFPRLLNLMTEIFRSQANEKGIKLTTKFSCQGSKWILMDSLRIRQIFSNLLSNSIKFSDRDTEIVWTVCTTDTGKGMVHLKAVISDQGCGMSNEFMKKMFQPFEQGETKSISEGTGLGLSIVKNLVEMMNGKISVVSKLNEGTSFTIEMDREKSEPVSDGKPSDDSKKCLSGRKILLCDDNEINALVAGGLLEKAGCIMEYAKNGQLAVEKFSASKVNEFDAIMMDVRMPVMDGLEASRKIRALPRKDAELIPIIAMSANAFDEDIAASVRAGMNAYITKPVETENMYKTLAEQISQEHKEER